MAIFWGDKMRKYLGTILAFCMLLLFCTACENPIIFERKPSNQPGTTWKSEDGTIEFSVLEGGYGIGKIYLKNGEFVDFVYSNRGLGSYLYNPRIIGNGIYPEDQYEYWVCSFESKEKFVAVVMNTGCVRLKAKKSLLLSLKKQRISTWGMRLHL